MEIADLLAVRNNAIPRSCLYVYMRVRRCRFSCAGLNLDSCTYKNRLLQGDEMVRRQLLC